MISNLSLPNYLSTSKQDIKFFNIDALPFLVYSNGIPCYEANSYLIYKLKFGYSQKYNGGTYRIFANHLTHFIRFTFSCKRIENFSQFDNNLFSDFMDYLQDDPYVRSNNQIISIAYQIIDFLFFIAELYNINNFIGIGKNYKISLSSKNKKVPYLEKIINKGLTLVIFIIRSLHLHLNANAILFHSMIIINF